MFRVSLLPVFRPLAASRRVDDGETLAKDDVQRKPVPSFDPRRVVAIVVGLLLLVVSGAARAEEPEEPPPEIEPEAPEGTNEGEIIIEARRGVPQVSGSATILGAEELERWGYDDVQRVLTQVPGVYVRGEDGFGLRPNIGMRGANSDRSARVTLMEDGVLLAPAPYAAPAAYFFPMTTRMVGLEVIKGPAATRHGPQTVGGAVNLVTRPVPDHPAGAVDAAFGLRRTAKVHAWGAWGSDRGGVLLEGVHLGAGGFKQLDGGGPTGFDHQELMLKARVNGTSSATVRHAAELKLGYARERSHETYLGLSAEDFEVSPYRRYAASAQDLMRWQRTQAELSWRVDSPNFDLRTVAYHHWLTRVWTKLNAFDGGPDLHDLLLANPGGQAGVYQAILRGDEDSTTPEQTLLIGTNDRRYHAFGLQSVGHWRAGGGVVRSELELGLRLHVDVVDRLHTESPYLMRAASLVPQGGPEVTTLDARTGAIAFAGHLHEDLRLGPIRLLPGLRVEVIRSSFDPAGGDVEADLLAIPLPGVGIVGEAAPWASLFAGIYRGFSPLAPGSSDEVRPETSWNGEAGLRLTPGAAHVEVVGFLNDYVNLTGACTFSGGCADDQVDRSFNGGRVRVGGLEAVLGQELGLPLRFRVRGDVTYTWTASRFLTGFSSEFPQFGTVEIGDQLPYVPEHQGRASIGLSHPRFSLSVSGNLRGTMRDEAGQGPPGEAGLPMAFTVDIAGDVRFSDVVSAYVQVLNATDAVNLESWRPFGARPGLPLQVMMGMKVLGGP